MRLLKPATRIALAVVAAGSLAAQARADYSFTLTGTITAVNDLSTVVATGQQIHLLPEFTAGQAITATGGFTADPAGNIQFYLLNIPGLISHIDTAGPSSFVNLNDLNAGFRLSGGGFPSSHPAVIPHLAGADFDQITAFLINGSSFSVNLFHSSLQLSNVTPSLSATFTSISVVPVPEPASAVLLAAGLAGVWAWRRRRV